MNVNTKVKNRLGSLLLALLFWSASAALFAQSPKPTDLASFKITIETTETGIRLEGLKGSAWLDLSFNTGLDKQQAIDEYGMTELSKVSTAKDSALTNFLFTITKTKNGVVLKGLEGAAWTELSFALPQHKKQTIDQFGMTQ